MMVYIDTITILKSKHHFLVEQIVDIDETADSMK
jgi:hypothetical protein